MLIHFVSHGLSSVFPIRTLVASSVASVLHVDAIAWVVFADGLANDGGCPYRVTDLLLCSSHFELILYAAVPLKGMIHKGRLADPKIIS